MKKLQPVAQAAKAVVGDLLDKGLTVGEIVMTLSIAKQVIKKDQIKMK
ncbi:hypothetical protein [Sporomusa acidovorans]|uniref:Uncharacterized protein n=1 Tax=Sporomusa acidovorans (strain ATCC 49682 / DSM 3132 / Mol) TaxID=1123286 RepID=A0ABZ3J9H5_SPOA4|nr:hypothetical protein [Sporomusa acidovorans]OZC16044.1 hypothetical protein SPACI_44100 [Sporomusa acidovorans DSM 3132]SDD88651.1 hypothetical protein SAMN04488499_100587 [Sporomusa acidovorans]